MADEAGGIQQGQGAGEQDSQGGQEQGQQGGQGTQGGQGGEEQKTFDAAYVKQLRDEAAANRRKAADAEKKLKALEDEKLSDSEKREKRLKELETENVQLKQQSRRSDIVAAAAAAGAINPQRVARLIDDDAEDVTKAVAELKKSDAYLFGRPGGGGADGGAGGREAGSEDMNTLLRRAAGRG